MGKQMIRTGFRAGSTLRNIPWRFNSPDTDVFDVWSLESGSYRIHFVVVDLIVEDADQSREFH